MTYDDIIDWTDENEPMELFDSFSDFVKSVQSDFARHGHFFPASVISDLAEEWESRTGEEINESTLEQEIITTKIAQAKTTTEEIRIVRNAGLSPVQIRDARDKAQRSGITIGKRLRVKDMRIDLARRQRQQEQRIKRQQKLTKRQKKRQKKPKFQRRLSKKERKKRGHKR